MDALGTGLILMVNGLLTMVGKLASPATAIAVVLIGCAWWLATIEVEELNRLGVKPDVGRH